MKIPPAYEEYIHLPTSKDIQTEERNELIGMIHILLDADRNIDGINCTLRHEDIYIHIYKETSFWKNVKRLFKRLYSN